MSYSKLFGSIIHSSIWQESPTTKVVWVTMLAMKDRDGLVEASIIGLAKAAGVTLAETEAAIAVLLAPDPYSRTPDHEGRRIEVIAGGWRVLNHDLYRDKLDQEERREKKAKRQAKWRERQKDKERVDAKTSTSVYGRREETPVDLGSRAWPHADADADADADAFRNRESLSGSGSGSSQLPDPGTAGGADLGRPAPAGPERTRGPVAHPHAPPLVTPSADARERQRLVERFRDAIGKARAAVTTKFGLTGVRIPLPLHGGENETELRQRLKDAGARASEDLEHVIAVATAEAMASKDGEGIRWLGWNLGRSRSWDRALATSPELAAGSGKAKSVFDAVDAAVERLEREHGGKP